MALFKRMGTIMLMCLALPVPVWAKDLGTFGRTVEISESDLLQDIQTYVASPQFAIRQQDFVRRAQARVQTPKPVVGIHKTQKPRTFYFDPSLTITRDLSDQKGEVFAHAGTKINPLEKVFFKGLLFFDGEDGMQVDWVRDQIQQSQVGAKLVLTRGNPAQLSETLGQPVFFDQSGRLVGKFGIKQVPATVVQDASRLKIKEILLDESGKEVKTHA